MSTPLEDSLPDLPGSSQTDLNMFSLPQLWLLPPNALGTVTNLSSSLWAFAHTLPSACHNLRAV